MPRADVVERSVWNIEGFHILIMQNDVNFRGDKQIPKQYVAERMSKNSFTVSKWKSKFQVQFPRYDVQVLNADGSKARGNTLLSTVRDTYLD